MKKKAPLLIIGFSFFALFAFQNFQFLPRLDLPAMTVRQAYWAYFGREPGASEIAWWKPSKDQSQLEAGLFDWIQPGRSGEQEYRSIVTKSYQVVFGRDPAPTEVSAWTNINPRPGFRDMVELQRKWLRTENSAYAEAVEVIKRAYLAAEGRAPWNAELNYWITVRPDFTSLRNTVALYFDDYRKVTYSSCADYLLNSRTGLIPGIPLAAERNTIALQRAMNCTPNLSKLTIPEGVFWIKTLNLSLRSDFILEGWGMDRTRLARVPFEWDNNLCLQTRCFSGSQVVRWSMSRWVTRRWSGTCSLRSVLESAGHRTQYSILRADVTRGAIR